MVPVAVVYRFTVSTLLQPVARVLNYFGPVLPQKRGDRWHEGKCLLLLIGDDKRAIGEGAQGDFGQFLFEVSDVGDVHYFRRKGEVCQGAEHFFLVVGELLCEVAEDEFERIILRWTGAQEGERVSEGATIPATDLAGHPYSGAAASQRSGCRERCARLR